MTGWAHIPSTIDPILFSLGHLQVRWYGLMYVAAFITVYVMVRYRIRTEQYGFSEDTVADFMLWVILGVLVGGRIGYIFFYDFHYFLAHPLRIILPFTFEGGFQFTGISGMSYHGGLLGVLAAFLFFCRKRSIDFWRFTDLFIPPIALAYTFGRIGNFLNGELYGRATTACWGMYFPQDTEHMLRHPSQLYEAFFEGIFLFSILWPLRKKNVFGGFLFSLYFIGYGTVRFFIEFTREPDAHIGLFAGIFSMGQLLCFGMILTGICIYLAQLKKFRRRKS
ncbi:prolipoprotein diacylglyceryl transferase [bacterium]|nr:prolipoprotein diacylglyceryl transferase [bacterium]MCP5462831.1 prolipoprotein diacylglyceryl transferase [bacterium]